jgi:2-haloacid dehalogenase
MSEIDLASFRMFSFDCYGTLIDWEAGLLEALAPICARHGLAWSEDALLSTFGATEHAVEAALIGAGFPCYREVLARVLTEMGKTLGFQPDANECARFAASVGHWPAFPDSEASLRELQSYGKLAILSNVDNDLFVESERRLGIKFDHVFTAQDIGSYKPSPNNFEYLIEHASVPKHQILHVAQSLFHDVAPASAAGLTTVWVNRRKGRKGEGATPTSDAIPAIEVPDMATLAQLLRTGS